MTCVAGPADRITTPALLVGASLRRPPAQLAETILGAARDRGETQQNGTAPRAPPKKYGDQTALARYCEVVHDVFGGIAGWGRQLQ